MLTIRDKQFTGGEKQPVLSPENGAANAIGDENCPVRAQASDPGLRDIKIGIVFGDYGVLCDGIAQFGGILNSSRNDGVRIVEAVRFS
jgi:hypothetical protein